MSISKIPSDGGISRDTFFSKLKLVIVGDSSVGKTCILHRFLGNEFYDDYVPTIIENQWTEMKVENRYVKFELWDTAGQEDYSQLRRLSYHLTDLFIIVLSVVDTNSVTNALNLWHQDLTMHYKNPTILFLGNKIDMRTQEGEDSGVHISTKTAEKMINDIGYEYLECSAKEKTGIEEVFRKAAKICLGKKDQDLTAYQNGNQRSGSVGLGCCSQGAGCRIF